MTCNPANLSPVVHLASQALLPVVWDYTTSDDMTTVDTYGYFGPACNLLRYGDIIRATADDGKGIYFVDAINFLSPFVGVVKMADVSAFV